MKKTILASSLIAFTLTLTSGCASGPNRAGYSWDRWRDQKYAESSWVHGALLQDIIPVYSLVGFVATVGDVLIFNPWHFWTKDAWDGKGTTFVKKPVENPGRSVEGIGFDQGEAAAE